MLDAYFSMDIVERMIHDLETNPRYNDKTIHQYSNYGVNIKSNLALYIFYDAIYKYKVVIDDVYLFEEYVEQIDKLYRKMDDFDAIVIGIHKILCNFVGILLDIQDIQQEESKKSILSYIYQKYILDGYYLHGFSTVYEDYICKYGFSSENYRNIYPDMELIDSVFRKHNIYNSFRKNFKSKYTSFTDDFVMACHYSSVSPGYFSNFLLHNEFSKKAQVRDYLESNYSACTDELKLYMNLNLFSASDANFVLKTVKKQWNFLNSVPKRVSILLIPRKFIHNSELKLEDYYHKGVDLYDAVDRMLCPKSRNLYFEGDVPSSALQILSFHFPKYISKEVKSKEEVVEEKKSFNPFKKFKLLDAYGVISSFIVIGSLFITLGIIVSIILLLRG